MTHKTIKYTVIPQSKLQSFITGVPQNYKRSSTASWGYTIPLVKSIAGFYTARVLG